MKLYYQVNTTRISTEPTWEWFHKEVESEVESIADIENSEIIKRALSTVTVSGVVTQTILIGPKVVHEWLTLVYINGSPRLFPVYRGELKKLSLVYRNGGVNDMLLHAGA